MQPDRDRALALTPVSRETAERLDVFVSLLQRWNPTKNLVAPSTLSDVWMRHIADSLQLLPLLGGARTLVDLGSGAGFPGLPLAVATSPLSGVHVHSIESKLGKAAFQREAARLTAAPVTVHAARIETVAAGWNSGAVDVVMARALAPLAELLDLAKPLLKTGARCLFLKGQDVERELTEATKSWSMKVSLIPSVTDPNGRVVVIESPRLLRDSSG